LPAKRGFGTVCSVQVGGRAIPDESVAMQAAKAINGIWFVISSSQDYFVAAIGLQRLSNRAVRYNFCQLVQDTLVVPGSGAEDILPISFALRQPLEESIVDQPSLLTLTQKGCDGKESGKSRCF
jgi:hypothetical protein